MSICHIGSGFRGTATPKKRVCIREQRPVFSGVNSQRVQKRMGVG